MKKIYINRWLAFFCIILVGIGSAALILHTISAMNAEYLSYVGITGS